MRQLEITLPPQHPLNTEVKVELTLEEIVIIRAVMGNESTHNTEEMVRGIGVEVNFINNGGDRGTPYKLYESAGEILKAHGYFNI